MQSVTTRSEIRRRPRLLGIDVVDGQRGVDGGKSPSQLPRTSGCLTSGCSPGKPALLCSTSFGQTHVRGESWVAGWLEAALWGLLGGVALVLGDGDQLAAARATARRCDDQGVRRRGPDLGALL